MKNLLLVLTILGTVSANAGVPIETIVPIDGVYAPIGFDSNDSSEVVVSGFLPNLCHKSPMSKIEINGTRIDVTITALKYDETNPYCPEMVVPFIETVRLGVLKKGLYDIVVNGKTMYNLKSTLSIKSAKNNSIDSHIYANIHQVETELGSQEVKFKGYNPSDCMVLDKVQFVSNKKDTYSVLPIMKKVSDFCPRKMVPFTYSAKVPNTINKNKVLLHVRVMNGKSVNRFQYK